MSTFEPPVRAVKPGPLTPLHGALSVFTSVASSPFTGASKQGSPRKQVRAGCSDGPRVRREGGPRNLNVNDLCPRASSNWERPICRGRSLFRRHSLACLSSGRCCQHEAPASLQRYRCQFWSSVDAQIRPKNNRSWLILAVGSWRRRLAWIHDFRASGLVLAASCFALLSCTRGDGSSSLALR